MPENEELDEQSLFEAAVSDEPETPVTEVAEVKETPEVAEKPEVVADTGVEKPEVNPDDKIPVWRREEMAEARRNAERDAQTAREQLAAERNQREALQRELSALKPKEEKAVKPDPLLDPEGYEKYLETKFEEKLLNDRREFSLANAHKTYGKEFEEAYGAAQKQIDPALKASMQESRDPGETLIKWHREQKTKAEIGGDLIAYKQRLRDEALKDPEFLAKAVAAARETAQPLNNGRPRVDLPPSLNGASRSNALLRPEAGDVPDPDLWNEITA